MSVTASELYFCTRRADYEQLNVKDIAPGTRATLRRLCRCDDRHGWVVGLFGCLWLLGGGMSWLARGLPVRTVGCALGVASLMGLSIALHEASHRLLFRNRRLNEFAGLLCGLPVLISLSAFRVNHRLHHARRGSGAATTEETLDFALFRNLPVYCLGTLIKSFGFVTALPLIAMIEAPGRVRWRMCGEYGLIIGAVGLAVGTLPPQVLWHVWGLPLLITALLSQVRAVAEHGLTEKGNVFTASRTVRSGRVLEFLMCNINYHLEHHLFPTIPWYNLPRAHAALQQEYRRTGASIFRSYRRFFTDFLRATWRGIRPHTRLVEIESAAGRPGP